MHRLPWISHGTLENPHADGVLACPWSLLCLMDRAFVACYLVAATGIWSFSFFFFRCSATVTRKLDKSRVQRDRERERDVSHALLHSFFSLVWLCYFEILPLIYLDLMCYTLS